MYPHGMLGIHIYLKLKFTHTHYKYLKVLFIYVNHMRYKLFFLILTFRNQVIVFKIFILGLSCYC